MRVRMMLAATAATAAAWVSLQALPANAAVRYDFTALSSFPIGADGETFTGAFSYTAPTFITGTFTQIPVASLSSCSAVGSLGPATCGDQFFTQDSSFDHVEFGLASPFVTGINYNFAPGVFAAAGTYATVSFGAEQAGTLVVTDLGAGVPEPAAWSMMLIGFGAIGLVARTARRRMAGVAA
jgi:hypothetical protein